MRLSDPFEFARRGQVLEGELSVRQLERVLEMIRPDGLEAAVSYRWEGSRQGDDAFLVLRISGDLVLACQRCLTDVVCSVSAERRFLLVPEGEDLPDDDLADDLAEDDFDPIHAGRNLDALSLLEDEVLLSLPAFPMHQDCSAPNGRGGPVEQVQDAVSPFAALGKLKRGN
ncbi:MAG: YceD family protein [Rhodocyclaceae bacterium]